MKRPNTDRELKSLFGEPVFYLAGITDPATIDLSAALMDRVHDGADALLLMKGCRDEQARYVDGLPFNVRLVLCMWLRDMGMASKLVAVAMAQA